MPKNLVKNSFWIAIAFFCATHMSYAQDNGPTLQNPFPTSSALINIGPNADGHLTMGGEYKQPKNVVEQQKPVFWTWTADIGYTSEYNFRGTDLMPHSPGGGFIAAEQHRGQGQPRTTGLWNTGPWNTGPPQPGKPLFPAARDGTARLAAETAGRSGHAISRHLTSADMMPRPAWPGQTQSPKGR